MSIIIRLQNLPWSANSSDIRQFFTGLSIPDGGVHIVGGKMGDAFITFSTDEDARQAMKKDGGTIKYMQVKLLLSSRAEMTRVIEQARQQNRGVTQPHTVVIQQPPRILTLSSESERRRGHRPSPHRRSRDRSLIRDRRHSPDESRVSKRDHSRSKSRSNRSSRDMDRRSDHFRREDRHYDDSHYHDDRHPERDSRQESKRYPDADHVNSKSQLHATEGFWNITPSYEQVNAVVPGLYPYSNQQAPVKSFQEICTANLPSHLPQTEQITPHKPQDFQPEVDQKYPLSSAYQHDSSSYHGLTFESSVSSTKDTSVSSAEQSMAKSKRHTRFEPEFVPASVPSHFATKPSLQNQQELPYNEVRTLPRNLSDNYSERSIWTHELFNRFINKTWNEKQERGLTSHDENRKAPVKDREPVSHNEKRNFSLQDRASLTRGDNKALPQQERGPISHGENRPLAMQDRGHMSHGENRIHSMQDRGPILHDKNRSLVIQDRGPMSHDENREHSMQDRKSAIHAENREHLMQERRPTIHAENREHPMQERRAMIHGENREHSMQDRRPVIHAENREHPMQERRPGIHAENRAHLMQERGQISHGENKALLMEDIGPRSLGEYRRSSAQDKGLISHSDSCGQQIHNNSLGQMPPSLTVKVRGLPPDARICDILDLFHKIPLPAANICIEANDQGLEKAFIRFENYNPELSGSRHVPLFSNSRPPNSPANQSQPVTNHIRSPVPPVNQGTPVNQTRPPPCISMKNLPEGVTNTEIEKFLCQMSGMPRAVRIMLRPDKTPSGEAFAELLCPADMDGALQLNGRPMRGNPVTIQPISFHEMSKILGRPSVIPPPPTPTALLKMPGDMERPHRPLLPQGPNEGAFRERPHMDPPGRPFGPARMKGT